MKTLKSILESIFDDNLVTKDINGVLKFITDGLDKMDKTQIYDLKQLMSDLISTYGESDLIDLNKTFKKNTLYIWCDCIGELYIAGYGLSGNINRKSIMHISIRNFIEWFNNSYISEQFNEEYIYWMSLFKTSNMKFLEYPLIKSDIKNFTSKYLKKIFYTS